MPTVAVIPPTCIEETREEALKHVNIPGLLAWANKAKFAVKPPSGTFETVEDLEGQLIVGNPDEAVEQIKKFEAARRRAPGLRLPLQVRPVVRADRAARQRGAAEAAGAGRPAGDVGLFEAPVTVEKRVLP